MFLIVFRANIGIETKKAKGQMQAGWQVMDNIKEEAGPGSASSPGVPTNTE